MIEKTIAIPLAWYPYASSSRIVHWLTRHHGKLSTVLKGALREKSPFAGEYDLFQTSELLFFRKPQGGLYPAKECALIRARPAFRSDWRACLSASSLTALVNAAVPEESPQPGLFSLFEDLLDHAVELGRYRALHYWMELRLCQALGHAPNLRGCLRCGTPVADRFSAPDGAVVCTPCAHTLRIPSLECPPDVLHLLRLWQAAELPRPVRNLTLSATQQQQINALLEAFLAQHLHLNPRFRQINFF